MIGNILLKTLYPRDCFAHWNKEFAMSSPK